PSRRSVPRVSKLIVHASQLSSQPTPRWDWNMSRATVVRPVHHSCQEVSSRRIGAQSVTRSARRAHHGARNLRPDAIDADASLRAEPHAELFLAPESRARLASANRRLLRDASALSLHVRPVALALEGETPDGRVAARSLRARQDPAQLSGGARH